LLPPAIALGGFFFTNQTEMEFIEVIIQFSRSYSELRQHWSRLYLKGEVSEEVSLVGTQVMSDAHKWYESVLTTAAAASSPEHTHKARSIVEKILGGPVESYENVIGDSPERLDPIISLHGGELFVDVCMQLQKKFKKTLLAILNT